MVCKNCNTSMRSGSTYERSVAKRYYECPKCHSRKYIEPFKVAKTFK